jgi:hypothetical protein
MADFSNDFYSDNSYSLYLHRLPIQEVKAANEGLEAGCKSIFLAFICI